MEIFEYVLTPTTTTLYLFLFFHNSMTNIVPGKLYKPKKVDQMLEAWLNIDNCEDISLDNVINTEHSTSKGSA